MASVSVRFRNKERGTRVKDSAKNCASKRVGRGWGRMEGNAYFRSFSSLLLSLCGSRFISRVAKTQNPVPLFIFLLWNRTETFTTQASGQSMHCTLTQSLLFKLSTAATSLYKIHFLLHARSLLKRGPTVLTNAINFALAESPLCSAKKSSL